MNDRHGPVPTAAPRAPLGHILQILNVLRGGQVLQDTAYHLGNEDGERTCLAVAVLDQRDERAVRGERGDRACVLPGG